MSGRHTKLVAKVPKYCIGNLQKSIIFPHVFFAHVLEVILFTIGIYFLPFKAMNCYYQFQWLLAFETFLLKQVGINSLYIANSNLRAGFLLWVDFCETRRFEQSTWKDTRIIIFLNFRFLGHYSFFVKYNKLFQIFMRAPCFPALKFKKIFFHTRRKIVSNLVWQGTKGSKTT